MVSTLDFGSDNPGSIPGNPTKPTRRFPGKNQSIMKFKLTASLDNLANESGLSISEFTQIVISQLIKSEAIEDIPDLWGSTVKDAIDGDTQVKTLVDILYSTGISIVTNRHFDALLELVIIGEHDCPKCGGEMEVIDGKYKRTFGDGYMTPYEFESEWEDKKCTNCGHVQIGTRYDED